MKKSSFLFAFIAIFILGSNVSYAFSIGDSVSVYLPSCAIMDGKGQHIRYDYVSSYSGYYDLYQSTLNPEDILYRYDYEDIHGWYIGVANSSNNFFLSTSASVGDLIDPSGAYVAETNNETDCALLDPVPSAIVVPYGLCGSFIYPCNVVGDFGSSESSGTSTVLVYNSSTSPLYTQDSGNIVYGLGVIVVILSIAFVAYIFNSISVRIKKPWH